jgi:hypothetical protein
MLGVALDLRHAHWLWIRDLSGPDPWHILPIAIIITMLFMQRMTPQPGMDPTQQKMMNLMMPVFLGFISLNLAAGLCLYWSEGNLIGIVQREDQNLDLRICFQYLAGCFQTVQAGHSDVENDDLGLQLEGLLDSFPAIARLSTDLPVGLGTEKRAQTAPDNFMIIGHENSKWHKPTSQLLQGKLPLRFGHR